MWERGFSLIRLRSNEKLVCLIIAGGVDFVDEVDVVDRVETVSWSVMAEGAGCSSSSRVK
jgi:hypothetical protein